MDTSVCGVFIPLAVAFADGCFTSCSSSDDYGVDASQARTMVFGFMMVFQYSDYEDLENSTESTTYDSIDLLDSMQ
jgi:hypothetical protein